MVVVGFGSSSEGGAAGAALKGMKLMVRRMLGCCALGSGEEEGGCAGCLRRGTWLGMEACGSAPPR